MTDWFTVIVSLIIGYVIGRLHPLFKKFMAFIEKEKEIKEI